MEMLVNSGHEYLLITPGNYGETFTKEEMTVDLASSMKCSNFVGETVDMAPGFGIKGILFVAHIGKFIKVSGGIMNTHSSYADGRIETLITCGALAGVGSTVLSRINDCATTDAAIDILCEDGTAEKVLEILTQRIHSYLQARAKGKAKIGAVIFSYKNDIQLRTEYADEIIAQLEV